MGVESVIIGWSMDKSVNSERTEPGGSSTAPDMMWISRNCVLKWKRRLGLDKNVLETLIRVWKRGENA